MDFKENKPIYLQLADKIMDDAVGRASDADKRLPSVRDYAAEIGVNPNTVNRSYTWLQDQGIIYNKRGIGYFLEDDAEQKIITQRQRHFIEDELPEFVRRWIKLGVSPTLFEEMYKRLSEKD